MFGFSGMDFGFGGGGGGGFDYGSYATPVSSGGFSGGFDYGSYATPVDSGGGFDYGSYATPVDSGGGFDYGSYSDYSAPVDYSGGFPDMGSYGDYSPSYNYTGTDSADFSPMGSSDGYRASDNYQPADFSSMGSSEGYKASDNYGDSQTESSFERFVNPRKLAQLASGFIPGPLGMAAKAGLAATDKNPGAALGKMAGSTLGGILGNAVIPGLGGLLGSKLGGWAADQMTGGDNGGRGGDTGGGAGMGTDGGFSMPGRGGLFGGEGTMSPGGLGRGLAGLYQGQQAAGNIRQAVDTNKQQQDFAAQQAQSLASMYGPNSAYSQELRQQLERKDAAGGRRSQYGPREVELQAKLAGMASQVAPNILAYNKQAMDTNKAGLDYQTQGNKIQGQQLNRVASLGNLFNPGRELGNIFGGGTPPFSPMGSSPGYRASDNYGDVSDSPMPESIGYRPSDNYGDTGTSEGSNFWDNW